MEINGERVTLEKISEWAQTAHQDNVDGLAVALLRGYEVRSDETMKEIDVAFCAHPKTVEQARAKAAEIKAKAE